LVQLGVRVGGLIDQIGEGVDLVIGVLLTHSTGDLGGVLRTRHTFASQHIHVVPVRTD
jgi:hypothetical protein